MKILFIVSDFDLGGVTSALKNLSNDLINRGHTVHVLNLPNSKLPIDFNKNIKLIELPNKCKLWNLYFNDIKKAKGLYKFYLIYLGVLKKILNGNVYWYKYIFKELNLSENYDISIGFRQGIVNYYMTKIINSKEKIGFFHADPDYVDDMSFFDFSENYVKKIACVSNAVKNRMKDLYPNIRHKFYTVYNLFDDEEIKRKSVEYIPIYEKNTFNIVTVSRIKYTQKCLDKIPEICNKLIEKNLNFKWTIVGDGPDKSKLKRIINDNHLDKYINLVGSKENPYPYIKNADLFVLTSVWESYGMVVMEALILGTPIVAGDYPALKEILENNFNGIIAENSIDGISKEIYRLIVDKNIYNKLKENCMKYNYSSDLVYKQFMDMINDKI